MYGMGSDLICRVVGNYRFSNDDADYRRYLQLEDLLGISSDDMSREAFDDTEVGLEKKKQKELKGGGGMSQGVSRMFRDMLEDYMPGGYFTWEPFARDMANDFYKMAYAQFKSLLPKLISEKLKKLNVDRSEGSIETDSETINKVIMDSIIYLHDHPEILKDGLVRAYRSREDKTDRGVGIADAFFVPRLDEATLAERLKSEGGENVKAGDADSDVLENLKDREEVKWKWKGIDEYGLLRFTLPELYGSREFTVKLPPEIQTIKPGTYTFKIKDVIDGRGAVLEFKDQHEKISGFALESIEEDGLGEDQLRKFINNGVLNRYRTFLRSQPTGKLMEDFLGAFSVGPDQISDAEDLAELIRLEGEGPDTSKGRGKEKVKKKYDESVERQREKLQVMLQRWARAPEVAKHFMKVTESDGAHIARAIGSQFPPSLEGGTGVPTFAAVFATQPVVEMVLRKIMSPHMPLAGGGKSMPWVHFAWEDFQKMAFKDPSTRSSIERVIRHKRKDSAPGMPVTDEEISLFLGSQSQASVSKIFQRLRDNIKKATEASRGAPELKKFFERREVFQSYVQGQLNHAVEQYIKKNDLSIEDPKDLARIEKFKDMVIKKAVSRMSSKSASSGILIHQLMVQMSV